MENNTLEILKEFVLHVLGGAMAFMFLLLVTKGLDLFMGWIKIEESHELIATSAKGLKLGMYGLEIFLFAFFMLKEGVGFMRKIWNHGKQSKA